MTKEELIEAFESGDMSRVEFYELALDTDLTVEEIASIIANQDEDL